MARWIVMGLLVVTASAELAADEELPLLEGKTVRCCEANGTLTECRLELGSGTDSGNPKFRVAGCTSSTSGFGAPRALPVTLTDYETGVPGTQRTARSWILTTSAPDPNAGAGVTNSRIAIWGNSGTGALTSAQLVSPIVEHSIDKVTCTAMNGEKAMTYFGGASLDYCEDCDRVIRLDWGINATGPSNVCY